MLPPRGQWKSEFCATCVQSINGNKHFFSSFFVFFLAKLFLGRNDSLLPKTIEKHERNVAKEATGPKGLQRKQKTTKS